MFNYHNIQKTFINDCTFVQTRALFNVKYSNDNLHTKHFHSIIHLSLLRSFCNGVPLAFAGWVPQRSREKKNIFIVNIFSALLSLSNISKGTSFYVYFARLKNFQSCNHSCLTCKYHITMAGTSTDSARLLDKFLKNYVISSRCKAPNQQFTNPYQN